MKNKLAFIVVSSLLLVVVLGCSQISELANKAANTGDGPKTGKLESGSFTLTGKEWSSYPLDDTDVTVDLPGKPSDKTPPLPPSYRTVFSAMNIRAFDEKDFQSSVTELVPTGTRKFKIKELAETNIAAMKKQIPNLVDNIEIRSDTNAKLSGTFSKNGKNYELRGCCIYKKTSPQRVWAVLTLFPKENGDAQTASERIINSAVFKDSTEKCP